MLDIAIDSFVNIEVDFIFVILKREVDACRIICLEVFAILLEFLYNQNVIVFYSFLV